MSEKNERVNREYWMKRTRSLEDTVATLQAALAAAKAENERITIKANRECDALRGQLDRAQARLAKLEAIGNCGSVESWLQHSDQFKRDWFAATLERDSVQCERIKLLESWQESIRAEVGPEPDKEPFRDDDGRLAWHQLHRRMSEHYKARAEHLAAKLVDAKPCEVDMRSDIRMLLDIMREHDSEVESIDSDTHSGCRRVIAKRWLNPNELDGYGNLKDPSTTRGWCTMGEHACADKSQCFEPCGDLGRSEEHAVVAQPLSENPNG